MADVSARLARPGDAPAIGRIQQRTWRAAYGSRLPQEVLDGLTEEALTETWRLAIIEPPSPRHHVLVACERNVVVGFSAYAPATDPDLDPGYNAELLMLLVDPEAGRRGHGSRLLTATVEHLRVDEFQRVYAWVFTGDDALHGFLHQTGWADDGAERDLDVRGDGSALVHQVRMHTDIREQD